MSTDPGRVPHRLPDRPSLRHLKAQAKDLLDAGAASSIADAQFQIARRYGFASWPRLKAHVDALSASPLGTEHSDRDALVGAIMTFLGEERGVPHHGIRTALTREIDLAGSDGLVSLKARLACAAEWDYYPVHPLARRIIHLLADRLILNDCTLFGSEHVEAVAGRRVVLVANHLSYADANLIDVLLHRSGGAALAERLTAMAGPKVFSDEMRRFASLCFGTIKTPQNTALSTEGPVMSAREVARAARRSIELAHERLSKGDALLVFAEGRRSRTGTLQPMLAGAVRYLELPDTWILPVGIAGSDALFPIGAGALTPVRIVVRVGPPIDARALFDRAGGDRRLIADAIGLAIARQLPKKYQGNYGADIVALHDARVVLDDCDCRL